MLRESMTNRTELNVESITSLEGRGTGILGGDAICYFVDAVIRNDDTLDARRETLKNLFGMEGLVDIAGVIGTFTMQTRIADATGLPFDSQFEMATRTLRRRLGADEFQSATNTDTGGAGKAFLSRIMERIIPIVVKVMAKRNAS